jgi:hypothetical protein
MKACERVITPQKSIMKGIHRFGPKYLAITLDGKFQKNHAEGKECLTRVDLGEGDADILGKVVCLGIPKVGTILP